MEVSYTIAIMVSLYGLYLIVSSTIKLISINSKKKRDYEIKMIELQCRIAHDIASRSDKARNDMEKMRIDDLNANQDYKMQLMMNTHFAITNSYKPQ